MISKLLVLGKQTARENFYYRFDIILFVLNFVISITVYVFIWLAIYKNGGQILDMTFEQVTTYYILVVSLDPIISWGINQVMGEAIRNGEILRELLNPISYFHYYFGIRLGELIEALVTSLITFVICSFLFGILAPAGILNFLFFILVVILSVIMVFFFELSLGMISFYTNAIWGVEVFKRAVIHIFSGMIAPIALFPEFLQKIVNFLPFKECTYTPINIYFGNLSIIDILQVIAKQGLWIIIFYLIARIIFKNGIKHITINGG